MNGKRIALVVCAAAILMPLANMGLAMNIGLEKPENAVENYDVAWFEDPALSTPVFLETGLKRDDFENPFWFQDTIVHIGNEFVPNMHKEIWLLVDYIDSDINRDVDITLLTADNVTYAPTNVDASIDGTQLMFYWDLPNQPAWEEITFPNTDYSTLTGNVNSWNLATICTPEPATLTLLCIGGLAMLKRRRRR